MHYARIGQQIDPQTLFRLVGQFEVECRQENFAAIPDSMLWQEFQGRRTWGLRLTNAERVEYSRRLVQRDRENDACWFAGLPGGIVCGRRVGDAWDEWERSFFARVRLRLIRECVQAKLRAYVAEQQRAAAEEAARQRAIREGMRSTPGERPPVAIPHSSPAGPLDRSPRQIDPTLPIATRLQPGRSTTAEGRFDPALIRGTPYYGRFWR